MTGPVWSIFDVGAPVVAYYALHAAGVSTVNALLAAALLPAASVGYRWLRHHRLDRLALFTLVMAAAGAATALLTGSVRLVFAKDALFTAVTGVWFLATARGDHPASMMFSRPVLSRTATGPGVSWDDLWAHEPRFQRIWRVCTAIQGVGLLLDAVVRVVIAFTVPVDAVPALTTAQYAVYLPLLLVVTNVYQARAGLFRMLRKGPLLTLSA
jgi:hypothetical protein